MGRVVLPGHLTSPQRIRKGLSLVSIGNREILPRSQHHDPTDAVDRIDSKSLSLFENDWYVMIAMVSNAIAGKLGYNAEIGPLD